MKFFTRKPKPPWYDALGYIPIPPGHKKIALSWPKPHFDIIVEIDPTDDIVRVLTNKGTYLNQEIVKISIRDI